MMTSQVPTSRAMAYLPTVETRFYAEFAKAENPIEFRQKIAGVVNNLALSDFAFVRMNGSDTQGARYLTNPQEQLNIYQGEGLYQYDRMVPYAKENTQPIFLSQMYHQGAAADNRVYELNAAFGYFDYYCIPLAACNGHGNVMLAVSQRGIKPRAFQQAVANNKATLHALCEAIDYVGTCKFPESFTGVGEDQIAKIIPLSLRVLEGLANDDQPLSEVARKLSITLEEARANLESIKLAFDAKTNNAAIKHAITTKLISYT